jgi:hypothetical protein
MNGLILLGCVVAGVGIYFAIVRPFLIPLEWRVPNGRAYQPTLGVARN